MAKQPPQNLFHLFGFLIGGDFADFTFYKNKRGKLVWFIKAPPKTKPSTKQTTQRNLFRLAATAWQTLTAPQRAQWELASTRASLCATGYDAFIHYKLTNDQAGQNNLASTTNTVLI